MSIDYLNLVIPNGKVREILSEWCALLGVQSGAERGRGIHGYERSFDLGGKAIIGFGGSTQKGSVLVSITGAGTRRIHSFTAVRVWAESVRAKITRLDIAADDLSGKVFNVRSAQRQWREGAFTTRGRPPGAFFINDLGSGKGSTFNVGSRLGGKFARVYEKGKQLGDSLSSWVRAELELHAKDRVIPLDALDNPVPYITGSFPYFSRLSLSWEIIPIIRKACAITLEKARTWCRMSAGRTINALLVDAGGDIAAVIVQLRRPGIPIRLTGFFEPDGSALHAV